MFGSLIHQRVAVEHSGYVERVSLWNDVDSCEVFIAADCCQSSLLFGRLKEFGDRPLPRMVAAYKPVHTDSSTLPNGFSFSTRPLNGLSRSTMTYHNIS